MRFDLQSHSLHSDGSLPAAEVVAAAARAGVEMLALTDHDTVDGVEEAINAGTRLGVRVVPATELSVVDEAGEDLHVLGYGIDHTAPALLDALRTYRADREQRAERMAARLRELGFELAEADLDARRREGTPIGRPHLAQAVLDHPANAPRLAAEQLGDVGAVIRSYLIRGKPAFLLRTIPSAADAVALIHEAGGVAVWAHPFWDIPEPDLALAVLDRFREIGIDGVEAFYVTHDEQQTRAMEARARSHGLLTTGSSDFHGPDHKHFSRFLAFDTFGLDPDLGPVERSAA